MGENTEAPAAPAPENKPEQALTGRAEEGGSRGPDGRLLPGKSGNPGGRPKTSAEFLKLVRERAPLAVYKLVEIMTKGRGSAQVKAAEIIIEQAYGKARQRIEATGKDGEPLIPTREEAIRALQAVVPAAVAAARAAEKTSTEPEE